jgi:RNA polymerase sigma factor (sigma-70 family)
MLEKDEEARLVLLAKAGSDEAFAALFSHFRPMMERTLAKYTPGFSNPATVEDLRSEARLALVEVIQRFELVRGLRLATMLRFALRRRIIDEIRRLNRYDSRVTPETGTEDPTMDESESPSEGLEQADLLSRLAGLAEKLSDADRELIRLRFDLGLSRENIVLSGGTGCLTERQVAVRLEWLLKRLREELCA